jgi:hypothetical protein
MLKRGSMALLLAIFIIAPILLAQSAFASVSISTPTAEVYNLGDEFSISATVSASEDTYAPLSIYLSCNGNKVLLSQAPYELAASGQVNVPIKIRLDNRIIGSSSGNCYIEAEYDSDSAKSDSFEISNQLTISMSLEKAAYNPSETLVVSGTITKKNSQPFTGDVNITIDSISLSATANSSAGSFKAELTIPDGTKSGIYAIKISAAESVRGAITNTGEFNSAFSVNQVPRSLEIAVSEVSIVPGNDISYKVLINDQTGQEIKDKEVQVKLINPANVSTAFKTIQSSESAVFPTVSNQTPGLWTLSSSLDNLSATKLITVEELQLASFSLVNDTLVVTNIGNIAYNKTINITIGSESKPIELQLSLGETKQYLLAAPDGEYSISINTDGEESPLGRSYLTGNVIDVKDLASAVGSNYMVAGWIVIILVLAWLVYRAYMKISQKRYYGKTSYFSPVSVSSSTKQESSSEMSAISTSTNTGMKQECAVISLKIRNLVEIAESKSNALETIHIALAKARSIKASVYEQNDYRTIVIPLAVAKDNLPATAAKLIQDMDKLLSEHNKKYSQKIDYGLGAHIGELIVERINGKYKFSPIGNTMQTARKIADSAKQESLISEPLRTKAMKEIKVQRKGDYYSITQLKDATQHSEFINKFMQRNKPK